MLSESCVERLSVAVSIYEKVIQDLFCGVISVKTLKLLDSNKPSFIEIFKLVEKTGLASVPASGIDGMDRVEVLLKVIAWRQKELLSFEEVSKKVQHFVDLCPNVVSREYELRTSYILSYYYHMIHTM